MPESERSPDLTVAPVLAPPQPESVESRVAAGAFRFVKRAIHEPLVYFLLLGAGLFVLSAWMPRDIGGADPSKQIALTLDDLTQLEMSFEAQWRRQPTPQEFDALVEERVKEVVLYREALALGLDKDDTIVMRRMAQKMQFIAEDVGAAHEPSPSELRTWFAANRAKFALPGRITFRQLYFSPDTRGNHARDDAAHALTQLSGQPIDSKLAASLGDPLMLQDYYADRAPEQLAKDFGPVFAQAVFRSAPGTWRGPLESGFGWHLVFVDSIVPGREPEFEEVEPDVKTAWLGEQKALAWRKAYDAMRAKYTVLLPKAPEAPAQ